MFLASVELHVETCIISRLSARASLLVAYKNSDRALLGFRKVMYG